MSDNSQESINQLDAGSLGAPDPEITTDSTPFKVRILWGEKPEPGDEPVEYAFATEAELDAFLHGVDEAAGWMEYESVSQNPDGTWEKFERESDSEEEADQEDEE